MHWLKLFALLVAFCLIANRGDRTGAMNAEKQCMENWTKIVTFCASHSRFRVLDPIFGHSTIDYSQEHDTLCIPKDVIKDNFPEKGKEFISAYEQLCGLALLFNANEKLPGTGRFKKCPIYGRGADEELERKLNAMNMLEPPEFPQYLEYLRDMVKYHKTIVATKLKAPKEPARLNSKQIEDICEVINIIEGNEISLDMLFTESQSELDDSKKETLRACLADIVERRQTDFKKFHLVCMTSEAPVETPLCEAIKKIPQYEFANTVVFFGHGGLDAFMGSLILLDPSCQKKIIIFTCNSQRHELPDNVSKALTEENCDALRFEVLDTYSSPQDMCDTIVTKLEEADVDVDSDGTMFVHGESGADILCKSVSLNKGYDVDVAAPLDWYEDFLIPQIIKKLYPNKQQHVVLTNPDVDVKRKGAPQRLVLHYETFAKDAMVKLVEDTWKDQCKRPDANDNAMIKRLYALQDVGLRMSVALKHDVLYYLQKSGALCYMVEAPAYNIYKIEFDESVECCNSKLKLLMPWTILKHRQVKPRIVESFIQTIKQPEMSNLRQLMANKFQQFSKDALQNLAALRDSFIDAERHIVAAPTRTVEQRAAYLQTKKLTDAEKNKLEEVLLILHPLHEECSWTQLAKEAIANGEVDSEPWRQEHPDKKILYRTIMPTNYWELGLLLVSCNPLARNAGAMLEWSELWKSCDQKQKCQLEGILKISAKATEQQQQEQQQHQQQVLTGPITLESIGVLLDTKLTPIQQSIEIAKQQQQQQQQLSLNNKTTAGWMESLLAQTDGKNIVVVFLVVVLSYWLKCVYSFVTCDV